MSEREEKNLISLRLSSRVDQYTKSKAEAVGVSQNAFLNVLIDLGLRAYESDIGFIPPHRAE